MCILEPASEKLPSEAAAKNNEDILLSFINSFNFYMNKNDLF